MLRAHVLAKIMSNIMRSAMEEEVGAAFFCSAWGVPHESDPWRTWTPANTHTPQSWQHDSSRVCQRTHPSKPLQCHWYEIPLDLWPRKLRPMFCILDPGWQQQNFRLCYKTSPSIPSQKLTTQTVQRSTTCQCGCFVPPAGVCQCLQNPEP